LRKKRKEDHQQGTTAGGKHLRRGKRLSGVPWTFDKERFNFNVTTIKGKKNLLSVSSYEEKVAFL